MVLFSLTNGFIVTDGFILTHGFILTDGFIIVAYVGTGSGVVDGSVSDP